MKTIYITPKVTATIQIKKHRKGSYIQVLFEEKQKETILHKRLLLVLDVLSSCFPMPLS